ncbi:MAG: dockerin type I repeat-containing protein [Chloroflexi bacterium]|nr:dockerin type I repeat-containing protein [Chloroflexota bacterium]
MTPEVLLGDVNCDGTLTSVDAVLVLQVVARLLRTLPCPENGDIDEDGALTALDAALILQHSAGLLTSA